MGVVFGWTRRARIVDRYSLLAPRLSILGFSANPRRKQQENAVSNDPSEDNTTPRGTQGNKGIKRRDLLLSGSSLIAASALTTTGLSSSARAELKEYKPGTTFP